MGINLGIIPKLNFQQAIKINGKLLYRSQEYPEWITRDGIVEYLFYDKWDKKDNLLPKPRYKVRLFVKISREMNRDGWSKSEISEYEKGEIESLDTKEKEEIKSII